MRKVVRPALYVVMIVAITGICYLLLYRPGGGGVLAAVTGLLAVIAAVISAFPAVQVVELQEEASQPCPIPFFDVSGRYSLLQLRVKNIGPNIAYDIKLNWKNRPIDHNGEEISVLDDIAVLLPDASVSVLVGSSIEFVKKYAERRFEGEIEFKNSKKRKMRRPFVCTTQEHAKRLIHDEELPKTLYELQKLPEHLERMTKALSEIRRSSKA